MAHSLTDRYDDRIAGVLSCYDRLLITGTVPVICYAEGMTRFLYANGIRIFDYPQFAQTLREALLQSLIPDRCGNGLCLDLPRIIRCGLRSKSNFATEPQYQRSLFLPCRLANFY
jgi:hypothetical protein